MTQSNIFFLITSIFVVVLTILSAVGGFYIVRILRNLSRLTDKMKNVADDTEEELRDFLARIRESRIFNFLFPHRPKKNSSKKTDRAAES